MDKRPVAVLTTIHNNSKMTITRRTQTIQKPTVIEKYNTYMGGVDKADQLVTYYGYPHFSKKWWKQVFFHLLDMTIVNAYILYKQSSTTKKLSHMDFQLAIAQSLISDCPRQPHSATSPSSTPQRLMGQHFPESGSSQDCKVCSHVVLLNVIYVMLLYAYILVLKNITCLKSTISFSFCYYTH